VQIASVSKGSFARMTGSRAATLLALLACAHGHGSLNLPVSRNGGSLRIAGGCGDDLCSWMTTGTTRGSPTWTDPRLDTLGITPGSDDDWCPNHPWRAPGMAPIGSPCGNYAGQDGRHLPPATPSFWKAGGVAEVAWGINANHGGGYSYRLCPTSSSISEACFQNHVLNFVGESSWLQNYTDEAKRVEIPAVRVTIEGAQWTKNPQPISADMFTPAVPWLVGYCAGGGGKPCPWNIIDKVRVPDTPGDFVVSWRWDCEETAQVWTNCGEVEIVSGPLPPPPPPSPTPLPPPAPPAGPCHALSVLVTDTWCNSNCPANCPANLCSCDGMLHV